MTSQQLQQLLLVGGIVLLVLGIALIGAAVYLFFARNIPDIRDDLSGKKRAEGIERKRAEQARGKQSQKSAKVRITQEQLAAGANTANVVAQAAQAAQEGAVAEAAIHQVNEDVRPQAAPIPQVPESKLREKTTVLVGDSAETSVLIGEDSATTVLTPITTGDELSNGEKAEESISRMTNALEMTSVDDYVPHQVSVADDPVEELRDFRIVQKIVLAESAEYVRVN